MTKAQFRKNLNEMLKDLKPYIKKKSEKILNSGCVELTNYANDFSLPKAFLHACLKELANQYIPYMPELKKDSKNISCFL